jgi:actin-related protein
VEARVGQRKWYAGSEVLHAATEKLFSRVNTQVFQDTPQNWDDLETLWGYVFESLGALPEEHAVLVTEPFQAPKKLRAQMTEIFFEKFHSAALHIASAPYLAAYAYGVSTGLIVDVGESSAQVCPVVDGCLFDVHARRVKSLGGCYPTKNISDLLTRNKSSAWPTSAHLTNYAWDIRNRMAFVSASHTAYAFGVAAEDNVVWQTTSPLEPSNTVLRKMLARGSELLFAPQEIQGDAELQSLPEVVRDVVMRCNIDHRKLLLSHIILSGGGTRAVGFKQRLQSELRRILPENAEVRLFDSQGANAAWNGGSVLASLPQFQNSWTWKWERDEGSADDEGDDA